MKFKYLMLLLALSVAGCAAYFSIWGLSQLFAGASTAVIIMASVLEVGKIVTTTALHNYWNKLARTLKVYLTISVGILMFITSAGIYGFLSNAYQKTANKLEIHEGEIAILVGKQNTFKSKITLNNKSINSKEKDKQSINDRLNIRTNVNYSNARQSRSADKQNNIMSSRITELDNEINKLNNEISSLNDSIGSYENKILELKSNSDIAAEVGPLKYISELTGVPMANVVNYLILMLIFVFDPLAVALVLVTNKVFSLDRDGPEPIVEDKPRKRINIKERFKPISNNLFNKFKDKLKEKKEIIETDDEVVEEIVEEPEEIIEQQKLDPVIPTGTIKVDEIKEKRQNRGFSVDIPKPNNTIERIGSNKIVKDGDNSKIFFRKN